MVNFPPIEPIDYVEAHEWLEELPTIMVEPETRSNELTESLPGMSELLDELETLKIFKEQAK